jgi:hypothetical protein
MKESIVSAGWISLFALWMIVLTIAMVIIGLAAWRQRQRKRAEGDESDWPHATYHNNIFGRPGTVHMEGADGKPVEVDTNQYGLHVMHMGTQTNEQREATAKMFREMREKDAENEARRREYEQKWGADQAMYLRGERPTSWQLFDKDGNPTGLSMHPHLAKVAKFKQAPPADDPDTAREDKMFDSMWVGGVGVDLGSEQGDFTSVMAHGGGKPYGSIHDLRAEAVEEDEVLRHKGETLDASEPTHRHKLGDGRFLPWTPEQIAALDSATGGEIASQQRYAREAIARAVNAEVAPDHLINDPYFDQVPDAEAQTTHFANPDTGRCECRRCRAARWGAPDGSIPKELETDAPHVEVATIATPIESQPEKSGTDLSKPVFWRQDYRPGVTYGVNEQRSGENRREFDHGESQFGEDLRSGNDRRAATIATPQVSQPENSETKGL